MLKFIGFLLMIHAAISLIRFRKHLIFNDEMELFTIPIDVIYIFNDFNRFL